MSDDVALTRLGKYEVRGTLGKGAMGTVHDGWDPVIARRVAIKTVRLPDPDDAEGQDALARFRREAQAAGRLSHPNIVGVFDYGETEALAYIVMEFVDGRTLKHLVDEGERFAASDAVRVLGDVLDGLAYSHGLGVVHRDIKPANIMMTASGRAKIADFGIARIESSSLTQAGTVLGTPAYMSPEQFMGQAVDRRSDIYSAGVLLYQLLTGERPFEGSLTGIMHKVLNTTPPCPSEISVTSPASLDAVVARAMARRPEDRFDTAEAFAAAMREAMSGRTAPIADETVVARAAPAVPAAVAAAAVPASDGGGRKRRGPLLAGVGVLVLAGIGAGAFLLLPGRKEAVQPAPPAAVTAKPAAAAKAMAPAPPAPAPPTDSAVRAALGRVLPGVPCSLVQADVDPDRVVRLRGVASDGAAAAVRDAAVRAGAARTEDRIATTSGPYCDVLDVLRGPALSAAEAGSGLLLGGDGGVLTDNQVIAVSATMPPFPAYLSAAYLANDGTVSPLVPGPGYPARSYAPGAHVVFGQPGAGLDGWRVGPPFGTDMLVMVASSVPLFGAPLPASEPVAAYAKALGAAIEKAHAAGALVSPAALLIRTAK